jgi:hypothetical protein
MNTWLNIVLSAFVSLLLVARIPATSAQGQPCSSPGTYSFVKIADTAPDSLFSDLAIGQAINNGGQVAFVAKLKTGGSAIYRASDTALTTIARTGENDVSEFTASPYMNDAGLVSVVGTLTDGTTMLSVGDGGVLLRLGDTSPTSPIAAVSGAAPRIDRAGTLWFRGTLRSGETGYFGLDGGLPRIYWLTGGQFSGFPAALASR